MMMKALYAVEHTKVPTPRFLICTTVLIWPRWHRFFLQQLGQHLFYLAIKQKRRCRSLCALQRFINSVGKFKFVSQIFLPKYLKFSTFFRFTPLIVNTYYSCAAATASLRIHWWVRIMLCRHIYDPLWF